MQRIIRWQALSSLGLEHLCLHQDSTKITAESLIVGTAEDAAYGLRYHIVCDPGWRVQAVRVELVGEDRLCALTADGSGHWFDATGSALPQLDGCIDVDIEATPFTNTLPIRRLDLPVGESRDIRVLYITVPDLELSAVMQTYTCLRPGRLYRYAGFPSGFSADLETDPDGLVIHYPELFQQFV